MPGILEQMITQLTRIADALDRQTKVGQAPIATQISAPPAESKSDPVVTGEPETTEPKVEKKTEVKVEDKTMTRSELTAKCKNLIQAFDRSALTEVFEQFGAEKLAEIDAADYAKVAAEITNRIEKAVIEASQSLTEKDIKALRKQFNVKRLTEPKDQLQDVLAAIREKTQDCGTTDEDI